MTNLERKAIAKLIERVRGPSVLGSEWSKELGRVEHTAPQEASRLLDSEDYRKGWEACYSHFAETLKWIAAKPSLKELKQYAR